LVEAGVAFPRGNLLDLEATAAGQRTTEWSIMKACVDSRMKTGSTFCNTDYDILNFIANEGVSELRTNRDILNKSFCDSTQMFL